MRVLLDANILISYLLPTLKTSAIHVIVRAAISGRFTLLLHEELTSEIVRKVGAKRYLSARITTRDVQTLFNLLWQIGEEIPTITEEIPPLTRDPKDDYLLAYALVGRADYLVTGDDDLLVLGQVGGVKILRPADFARLVDT